MRALVLLLVLITMVGCKTTTNDPAELQRVWDATIAEIPQTDGSRGWQWFKKVTRLPAEDVEGVWPTVIFMHGCNGGSSGSLSKVLLGAGFAVVSPNSLARRHYQGSCRPIKDLYGLRSDALAIRRADLAYTIEQVKKLSWVDTRNVFIIGHSEGGRAVAGFRSGDPEHSVRARVIGGDNCWGGIHAPRSEPVLAIMGEKDAVILEAQSGFWGSCGRFMYSDNGSRNIVMPSAIHGLITGDPASMALVVEFLQEHRVQ